MSSASSHSTAPLPPYFVVELERDPDVAPMHDHVVAVTTRDPDGGETRWDAGEVLAALRHGERFVAAETGQGGETLLESGKCPVCDAVTLTVPQGA